MTMIGFVARDDCAQIITDSLRYTGSARAIVPSPASKVTELPGMPAVAVTQGTVEFGRLWGQAAPAIAAQVADFDQFTVAADDILPSALDHLAEVFGLYGVPAANLGKLGSSAAFHIGWSPAAGRFVAHGYASEFAFQPMPPITGMHIMPTPFDYRPGLIEHLRVAVQHQAVHGDIRRIEQWARRPPPPVPGTVAEWVELAKTCHRSRALDDVGSGLKVLVGGDVELTTLTRDGITTERIHTFDDPDEFRRMVAGTLHPFAQEGPCVCGTGRRFVDCCLAGLADQPCPCGTGQTFADCCSIYATEAGTDGPAAAAVPAYAGS